MTQFHLLASAVGASLLLSANAFAGSLHPAAGEAPFFNAPATAMSTLQRAQVQAHATFRRPATGEMNAQAAAQPVSTLTRAAVRNDLRQAVANGYRVAAGEANFG